MVIAGAARLIVYSCARVVPGGADYRFVGDGKEPTAFARDRAACGRCITVARRSLSAASRKLRRRRNRIRRPNDHETGDARSLGRRAAAHRVPDGA
jgi:hypothetical protein